MEGKDLAVELARICAEYKGEDIEVLDLHGLTDVTDYFIIATVDTQVQMKAILESIHKTLKKVKGRKNYTVEGQDAYRWVLLDFFDVVLHLFTPEAREFYELETLWGDAPAVDWAQPAGQ
jgi:ribosome-associated protein